VGNETDLNTSTNALGVRRAEIQAALAEAVARAKASETSTPAGMPAGQVAVRRLLLQRFARIYEQQLSDLAELETAKVRGTELIEQARNWSGFATAAPYSVLLTDGLRESLQGERLKISSDEGAIAALDGLIVQNRTELAAAEEKIRHLNEQLEGVTETSRITELSWRRDLEQIRSQVAGAAIGLLQLERQIREESLAGSRAHLDLLQRQLVVAKADTRFTEQDLEKVFANLEAGRLRLERDLAEAEQRQTVALASFQAARQSVPENDPTSSRSPVSTVAAEKLNLSAAEWDGAVTAVRVLRLQLEATSIERTLWELRFGAYGSRELDRLRDAQRHLVALTRRVGLWKDYFRDKLEVSANQLEVQESRLSRLDRDSELGPVVRELLGIMRQRDQSLLDMCRSSERLERLLQRWNEDLQRDIGNLPLAGRVRNLFSSARSFLGNLWAFELFAAEDTITVDGQKVSGKRSVTVGKIVGAILILVIGYWLTGLVSEAGRRFIQKYLHVEPNQGQLIRRWMRATMVVFLVLFSLVSVKIPLTVFAFAGGALAIGIGFGTQTVLKNVVSGLIILFERPFGVGDVLDVGGHKGTLTSIGLRASVLQLWDSTETLFPNSYLLENALTNWTYSNRIVRFTIPVGVAYGSDTRRVMQVLEGVLNRHGQIEPSPAPQVLFVDFGPSALVFEVRFWLNVLKTNAAQVSSDLRHMIAGAFSENGIVIAFPQSDVHLDAARPLQVEVVSRADSPASLRAEMSDRKSLTQAEIT
jgi:small-conductance mechanosensitive channel